MRCLEIFRFEVTSAARRRSTWLYFIVLIGLAFWSMTSFVDNARGDIFNAPLAIAGAAIIAGLLGLLITAALAGKAATRDVQARIEPLVYTTTLRKWEYLGGRFLGAFAVHAFLLIAVPIGCVIAAFSSGLEPGLLGPFRPAAYLEAYAYMSLPNAFVATALLFSMAVLSRRALASYVGGALLFLAVPILATVVAGQMQQWELARLLDPSGFILLRELTRSWIDAEKDTLLLGLDGPLLLNRLVWMAIAGATLVATHSFFSFSHHASKSRWMRLWRGRTADAPPDGTVQPAGAAPVSIPDVQQTFGALTYARQVLAVAGRSFQTIVTSRGAIVLAVPAVFLVLAGPELMEHLGVPLVPTTERILGLIIGSEDIFVWIIAPFLTVIFSGELVWQEREAGMGEIAGVAPVPSAAVFLGKFFGLGLMLVMLQALLMCAGVITQAGLGYTYFEFGLYLQALFGLQLADHLLFALLALTVHVVVDQKYIGHTVVLVAFVFTTTAGMLGIEHHLLVFGSDPGWGYSDMRGFGPSLAPWIWFKLYWGAWALLFAVAARLLWVRGRERGLRERLRLARSRFTHPVAWTTATAAGLVLVLGGFIFYNTNVLNEYHTSAERVQRRAAYEKRYGIYENVAQPLLTSTRLNVEFYPDRREAEIRGTYRLVNESGIAIDSIHLATASEVETGPITFDRPAESILVDDDLGHRIYVLGKSLQPGDSLRMNFEVHFEPGGFTNSGISPAVSGNGSYITGRDWMPVVGYQPARQLSDEIERRKHGLAPDDGIPSLDDPSAAHDLSGREHIFFEAVIGTSGDQIAVAPGVLRRQWTQNGRNYFRYVTGAPIRNDYAFFSADYAVHEGRWQDVLIQIFHDRRHDWNVDRMLRSATASLEYYSEQFGAYPYDRLRLIEHPGDATVLHASPINISYDEGFAVYNPAADTRNLDFTFAVVAHEVAHQWWGDQLVPAFVEGAPVLTESLAWYSAFGVVENTYGRDHLKRLLDVMRSVYLTPRTRAGVPLLRATDNYLAYRKGPFAMYALREYLGEKQVNTALRRLFEEHKSGEAPLPTSLDLYAELQSVTPDSLEYLLDDLLKENTYWQLEALGAHVQQTAAGEWQVTLDVSAHKVVVDTAGVETAVPMNDLVEIAVYSAADEADEKAEGALGKPLYQRLHRVQSGQQTLAVTVPASSTVAPPDTMRPLRSEMAAGAPTHAGIDPRNLLIDIKTNDNIVRVQ